MFKKNCLKQKESLNRKRQDRREDGETIQGRAGKQMHAVSV